MRIGGLVLAGGRSSRFGSEKAIALMGGEPLVAHVAAALRPECVALAVNARPESGAAVWARDAGLPLLSDPPALPDGPLTGVLQGLRWAAHLGCEALATSPCDTPGLPGDLVARLAAAIGDAPCAYARTASGSHPLCTIWRVELAAVLEPALGRGHPSVRDWLAQIGAAPVTFEDAAAFANVNTPGDLAEADKPPRIAP